MADKDPLKPLWIKLEEIIKKLNTKADSGAVDSLQKRIESLERGKSNGGGGN